uniref:Protein DBF4 homolog A n=1 Tax=Neogobius melanostomus TaxID=47308 RepID=A0A8C6URA8_9GOBI
MKPRRNRSGIEGSEKPSLIQTRPTPRASQTKPFTGKVFYLDLTSNRVAETLESDIKDLGGTVEKFFSKEIKYLVSNKREAKYVQCLRQDSPIPSPESGPSSPQPGSSPHQPQSRRDITKSTSQLQKDSVATSRGKSLVKRVVKEQERIHMNKILSNALDWGVKILYLDGMFSAIFSFTFTVYTVDCIKTEPTKRIFQKSKVGRISKPFVKVEDSSRHYQPFYLSLTNIPEFNLTTLPPCTPFCPEDKGAPGNKPNGPRGVRASASDERLIERKKKKQGGYCECCLMKYDNITAHLQCDRHKAFAKSDEYIVVDKLVSAMRVNFSHRSKLKRCVFSTFTSYPALSEVLLSDHSVLLFHRLGETTTAKVQSETSPETLTETKITKVESSQRDAAHSGSLEHKQMTNNCVFQTHNSSEDFVQVERIHRKIKVYKRKRRKVPSPVVSECVEPREAADNGVMRLWELFQDSDNDLEFYGFE